jgi:hypothetical protein
MGCHQNQGPYHLSQPLGVESLEDYNIAVTAVIMFLNFKLMTRTSLGRAFFMEGYMLVLGSLFYTKRQVNE